MLTFPISLLQIRSFGHLPAVHWPVSSSSHSAVHLLLYVFPSQQTGSYSLVQRQGVGHLPAVHWPVSSSSHSAVHSLLYVFPSQQTGLYSFVQRQGFGHLPAVHWPVSPSSHSAVHLLLYVFPSQQTGSYSFVQRQGVGHSPFVQNFFTFHFFPQNAFKATQRFAYCFFPLQQTGLYLRLQGLVLHVDCALTLLSVIVRMSTKATWRNWTIFIVLTEVSFTSLGSCSPALLGEWLVVCLGFCLLAKVKGISYICFFLQCFLEALHRLCWFVFWKDKARRLAFLFLFAVKWKGSLSFFLFCLIWSCLVLSWPV